MRRIEQDNPLTVFGLARGCFGWRPMAGRAMLTTVASSAAMPEPSTVIASTHRPGAEE
jgi:hypothetical protein